MLPFYTFFSLALCAFYAWLTLGQYWSRWQKMPVFDAPDATWQPSTTVSVVVAARNEAVNILALLDSILQTDFPNAQLEIIVADDHSDDATAALVAAFAQHNPMVRLLQLQENVGKKNAIAQAIAHSKHELIVATDADCRVPKQWLRLLTACYEREKPQFIAAPVVFMGEKNRFERFQALDFAGMMGVTAAGIDGKFTHMSNGANLAYPRSAYEAVGGFEGIDGIASGDDMLLMHKIAAQFPNRITFLKNAAVATQTPPQATLRDFVRQRVRWGSKARFYTEYTTTAQLAMVFFFAWNMLFSGVLALFFTPHLFFAALFFIQLLTKTVVDYIFLGTMAQFFGRRDWLRGFWVSEGCHIVYIAVVGLLSNIQTRYVWKGRRVV